MLLLVLAVRRPSYPAGAPRVWSGEPPARRFSSTLNFNGGDQVNAGRPSDRLLETTATDGIGTLKGARTLDPRCRGGAAK